MTAGKDCRASGDNIERHCDGMRTIYSTVPLRYLVPELLTNSSNNNSSSGNSDSSGDGVIRIGGPVVKGFGRGSKLLGVPTANLPAEDCERELKHVPLGVYAGWAMLRGRVYKTVMSIGNNPYFGNKHKTIEPYLLHQFDKDFYGEELKIVIVAYIRDMDKKFGSLDELIAAIHNDIEIGDKALEDPEYKQYKTDPFLTAEDQ